MTSPLGFEKCEFGPDDQECESCCKPNVQLYFQGPTDAGRYLCLPCINNEISANFEYEKEMETTMSLKKEEPSLTPEQFLNQFPWHRERSVDDITLWFRNVKIDPNLFACQAAESQLLFVRDQLPQALATNSEEYNSVRFLRIKITGYHTSKSHPLPVYEIEYKGTRFTLRNNFHDWKLSVELPHNVIPIKASLANGLIWYPSNNIPHVYLEGFPKDRSFGPFTEIVGVSDKSRAFTVEILNKYFLFTFLFNLSRRYINHPKSKVE